MATTSEPRAAAGATFEPPDADGIGRIVIDRPDDAVNALNLELMEALGTAVRAARTTEGLRGLVVASAKPGQWIAGADLRLVTAAQSPVEVEAISRRFQAICDELAWLPCTTVAAISGPALGGGCEVALACDYRVAAETPAVTIGLPEVSLGLVPAGGGTQRLPRLIGLERALDLILAGRRLDARRARRAGLLDEVVHPAALDRAAHAWALKPKRSHQRPLKLTPSVQGALELAEQTSAGRKLLYRQARKAVLERTRGHYPAPLKALEAVAAGLEHGMAEGFDVEARAFAELATGPIARNLIWLFLATQRQKRDPGAAEGAAPARPVERLGVVGAGFMGSSIAEVAAAAGLAVRLRDVDAEAVARGLARVRAIVEEGVARRRFDARQARAILQRVSGAADYSGFHLADLVIEAVFEDLEVKRRVIRELEAVVRPEAVIATNTSALPIHAVAAPARHPERVVGMHFFSPAHRMPLLEVVRADATADWAVATAVAAGNRLGKTVIVVRDGPGFYTTRVLGVVMNEAALLLKEGAAMEEVDRAWTAFGFPVGPFVLYDEVGLEVAQHAGETVIRAFGDRLPAVDVVAQLVRSGATGRKSRRGFYLWPEPARRSLPVVGPLLRRRGRRVPNPAVYEALGHPPRRPFTQDEVQERLALLLANEAVRCLEEGVLRSPTDGDIGAVMGLGFPPYRGGPFRYLDSLGLAEARAALERLAQRHGARYAPAALLVEKASRGEGFYAQGWSGVDR